jgi:large subunit ribosomal protein L9
MRLFFLQDVPGQGEAGEIRDVAAGYARNYLIPRGLAVAATQAAIAEAKAAAAAREKREARLREATLTLAQRLAGTPVTIKAKVGAQDRLYGSVTNADIAAAISALADEPIDRRRVELEAPLRQVGSYEVPVRLAKYVVPVVTVVVEPEGV